MRRPAVLDHPETARGNLIVYAMVENDHAVRHVLLDPVACEAAVAPLAGHDRGDGPVLEPAEQAAELRSHDCLLLERAEQQLDGVEHDTLRPDTLDGVAEEKEQRLEVELPRLDQLSGGHSEGMDDQQLVPLEPVEVEAPRGDVGAH